MSEPEEAPRNIRAEYARALRGCTPKQRKWLRKARELDGQKWAACHALGYSTRTLHTWLRVDRIRAALALQEEMAVLDSDATRARQERELVRVAFANPIHFRGPDGKRLPFSQWSEDMCAAVRELKFDAEGNVTEVKLHPKAPAQAMLGKATGYLVDRTELTGPNGQPLNTAPPSLHVHLVADGSSSNEPDGSEPH